MQVLKTLLKLIGYALLAIVAYLSVWPVPIEPVSWPAPQAPGFTGAFAENSKLAKLQMISLGAEEGPEHVAFGKDGMLYTTVASGKILRMNADGSALETFASTGGRVLGFDFDTAGNLIAADAMRGLLSISPEKKVLVLASEVAGKPILYADAVVVAKSGLIYFTDASARFGPRDFGGTFEASVLDILEQSATGRVLEYNPATRATRVVAQGMAFANGLALSADEQSVFVAETGKYRIWKIALDANGLDIAAAVTTTNPKAKLLFDNLPGYPDNLMRGTDGKLWAGFAKPRGAAVDKLATQPFLRKVTLRLPRALWPVPPAYGHVMAFSEDGKVLASLQDPSGAYPETTGVTETADRLYVQSLHAKGLGWVAK